MKRKASKAADVVVENTDGARNSFSIGDDTNQISKLLGELQPAKKLLIGLLRKDEVSKIDESLEKIDGEEASMKTDSSDDELEESEEEEAEEDEALKNKDPFSIHFEKDLPDKIVEKFKELKKLEKVESFVSDGILQEHYGYKIGTGLENHTIILNEPSDIFTESCLKERLVPNWKSLNRVKKSKSNLSYLQNNLFKVISTYKDLFFANRNFDNGEEIRHLYTLHAVNHVLKTRNRILKNNSRLTKAAENGIEIEDPRDQGLTRPKVLIIVPFKDSCLKIVNSMIKICFGNEKKIQINQKKRFNAEFTSESEGKNTKSFRPEDFKSLFQGNIDDCFRLGISLSKNAMKLYAPFYSADILIASPLGLRTIIGSENEKQDYDFLSSIEMLIFDQADVFLMQNWEHVLTILDHLHKTPKSSHDADFSRIRMWNVNQWSKYYRQTLLFSSIQSPEINNIFNRYCFNFAGKSKLVPANFPGSVQQVVTEIPQVFHRVDTDTYATLADKRFDYFVNKVLPDLKSRSTNSIAIFVQSYFDFVRVRNYFKKEELSFVQISEYSNKSYASHARTLFGENKKQFLIFTGRFFFYYRYRITGIRHLLFYELPQYPHFYPEILNFMEVKKDATLGSSAPSCITLYSRYDAHNLESIIGSERVKKMLTGKAVHMIVTGS